MKFTSATANKLIKKLTSEKEFLLSEEGRNSTYICTEGEKPIVPDYSYPATTGRLMELDRQIRELKHAINVVNTTQALDIHGSQITIDEALIKMAQLNHRKALVDNLRSRNAVTRLRNGYRSDGGAVEYQYANYDVALPANDYEQIDAEITEIQLALDRFNQTFEFEAEIELAPKFDI